MGIDKENQQVLRRWDQRKDELRGQFVDLRGLPREKLPERRGEWIEVDPVIWFPKKVWRELPFHERRWVEVEAAAMSSRSAVLVGRSAARKLGMWVVSLDDECVEVALPSQGSSPNRKKRRNFIFRRSRLVPEEVLTYEGHRVTDPVRTFIDIARYHGFAEGLIALDYVLRRGKTVDEIERKIRLMGRAKGIAVARRCLKYGVANSESPYETLARALLIEAGIGNLAPQFEVGGKFVDICVDGWLVIEIDGDLKYEGPGGEETWKAEMKRQKFIGNQGFVFLRYSPDFIRDYPEKFIAQVRETLASREALALRIG